LSLRVADRIYVVSNYVREELIERFRISASRIVITGNGVDPKINGSNQTKALRNSYDMENERIVLYVGSIFNRRHLPVLIEAMSRLDSLTILVVIGENLTYPKQDLAEIAKKFDVEGRVRILHYVPDKVLQDYYQMADLFVYLSDYEGFGIPPLEAMSYGVPVVLLDRPSMNQTFRDAAYFVKQPQAREVSAAIQKCLDDPLERNRLIEGGKYVALRYNWEETARVVSEDWERLIAAKG